MKIRAICLSLVLLSAGHAFAIDHPWISDVFFYWYTWDYDKEMGGWIGGVYNTPLSGYYDSRSYKDDLRSLHQASEWGITDHFMDYWGPGWKDEQGNPREDTVMRAAEALRARGYNIGMSFYQDGTDFDMKDFAANLSPGRDTEFYVSRYGKSPAMITLHGAPFALIYGRNGAPKPTTDNAGFRTFLQQRYRDIAHLNSVWGTNLGSFADATLDFTSGERRADSIRYVARDWARKWSEVNTDAKAKWGLPGFAASFDVSYRPYLGYGYSTLAKSLCGPHSYGGIFGPPQDQDVERFIQAQVARKYNTIFLDTFKNYYHDWEIRIPGTCYPPDFAAFDRFWVQALMHYSEAILHLSWNEWWEGSNLEPCREYGKTFCEKNLLYSSIMQKCFDSIRHWDRGAKMAVLLNDHHWLVGGRHPEDIYGCIQALRRLNVPFDLLPDDFVTADALRQFDTVLAPTGGTGFGENTSGASIETLLRGWIGQGQGRRLLLSRYDGAGAWLPLRKLSPASAARKPGPDMNVFVDVGEPGDDEFLVDGCSQREDWGKLPAGAFGAGEGKLSVRWTPAVGLTTTFMMPLSPHRDHILRLSGSALAPNHVTVLVEGKAAGSFDVTPGLHEYEVTIPAAVIGDLAAGEVALRYDRANVPHEIDPKRFPGESRVCNLAIDWVQLSTSNVGRSREEHFTKPSFVIRFTAAAPRPMAGRKLDLPYCRHDPVSGASGTVLSSYADGSGRDFSFPVGKNHVLYCNGLMGETGDDAYWNSLLLTWAHADPRATVRGDAVIGSFLKSGNTDIVLAYNYKPRQRTSAEVSLPAGKLPLAEVRLLSRDGDRSGSVHHTVSHGDVRFASPLQYYFVAAVVHSPVALETPELVIHPGEKKQVEVVLRNLTDHRATGRLSADFLIPTLTAVPVQFELAPKATQRVPLTLVAADDVDWGTKTVVFELDAGSGVARFWRTATVERPANPAFGRIIVDGADPRATIVNQDDIYGKRAAADHVRVRIGDQETTAGDVPSGGSAAVKLAGAPYDAAQPSVATVTATVTYDEFGVQRTRQLPLRVAVYPRSMPRVADATACLFAFNPHDVFLDNAILQVPVASIPDGLRTAVHVCDRNGTVMPSQILDGDLLILTQLPPRGGVALYLCPGSAPAQFTGLVTKADKLGTGTGTLTVTTQDYTAVLSEARGGTVTSLVSRRTGKDYGAGSFGVSYGTWGHYDVDKPAITTDKFVGQEKKTYQRDSAGRVILVASGPLAAEVKVVWKDAHVTASQRYRFYAASSRFDVNSYAAVTGQRPEELVVLDGWLQRNALTKIFPNFTGISEGFQGDHPDAGWREAPGVPPYSTLMTPDSFDESLSLIPLRWNHVDKYRHGFWPAHRPTPGPVNFADVEYVSTAGQSADFSAAVILHSGYQIVAEQFRATRIDQPPLAVVRTPSWSSAAEIRTAAAHNDWWNPYWHYRARIEQPAAKTNSLAAAVDFGQMLAAVKAAGTFDAASVRVVSVEDGVPRLLSSSWTPETASSAAGTLRFGPPASRQAPVYVYFDTAANGPKPPLPGAVTRQAKLVNPSFEEGKLAWGMDAAKLVETPVHSGKYAARLTVQTASGLSVISNRSMQVDPNARYEVTVWAQTASPGAALHANFYENAQYDFPQFAEPVPSDSKWHLIRFELPTGSFPPDVNPTLRFWALGSPQTIFVDDVAVKRLTPTQAPSDTTTVSVSAVESIM